MAKTLVSFVCVLILCAPSLARAQSYEDVGIRAQGMAGAFVAVADDATASWWNPAGLATSLSLADFIVEAAQGGNRGVALGFPSLGLSYYRLHISQTPPSGSTGPADSSRQDLGAVGIGLPVPGSVQFDQVGATMGQSIGGHLVVASTLRLGLTVRDVSAPTLGSGDGAFQLARRARAGVAVIAPSRGRLDRLTVAFDADLTSAPIDGRDERHIAGGAEAWVLGRRVAVRGGIGANIVGDKDERGSFEAFGVSVAPIQRIYIDAAVTRGPNAARDRWGFDLRVTF